MTIVLHTRQPRMPLQLPQPMTIIVQQFKGLPPRVMPPPAPGRADRLHRKRDSEDRAQADQYRAYLDDLATQIDQHHAEHRTLLNAYQPPITGLRTIADQRMTRLWERHADDPDFLLVRAGTGSFASDIMLVPPAVPPTHPYYAWAQQLMDDNRTLTDIPNVLPLAGLDMLTIGGNADNAAAVARGLIAQIVTFHSPDDVRIMALVSAERVGLWSWLGWLPHARRVHPGADDEVLVATTPRAAADLLTELMAALDRHSADLPRTIVVVDDAQYWQAEPRLRYLLDGGRASGIYTICVQALPSIAGPRITLTGVGATLALPPQFRPAALDPDMPDLDECLALARSLAPVRTTYPAPDGFAPPTVTFVDAAWQPTHTMTVSE